MVLLSSTTTAEKRRSTRGGFTISACTTTVSSSSSTACRKVAHALLKCLCTAVSLTCTAPMAAVELSCSKLASGCCIQPKTSVCSKSAPVNLRTRWMAPVSLAKTLARSLRMRFRSEEHTSELQSQSNLVCRLLLEKKTYRDQAPLPRILRSEEHTS